MPRYIVHSEGPIHVRQLELPERPGWTPEHPWVPGEGGPEYPDTGGPGGWPGFPERPAHPALPHLPPRDEWPELPPWLHPGVGLPIPPSAEHPMVPLPPDPEVDPPDIWPPPRPPIELPDLSGKTLALARIFVSRHVNYLAWVVIDHEEAKAKVEKAIEAVKARLPAGGIAGRPPPRPPGSSGD